RDPVLQGHPPNHPRAVSALPATLPGSIRDPEDTPPGPFFVQGSGQWVASAVVPVGAMFRRLWTLTQLCMVSPLTSVMAAPQGNAAEAAHSGIDVRTPSS